MTLSEYQFEARQEEERQARLEAYKRHWEYYLGNHTKQLDVRTGQPDDNVTINLAKIIVDKGAAFLFGKEIEFELQEGETTPEEEALEDIWQRNRKMTFLGKLGTSGGIYGHAFVKIVPDGIERNIPRLVSLEPENVSVYWDGDDIDSVWRYRIEYISAGRDGRAVSRRQDIERADNGVRWAITNWVARGGGRYQPDEANPTVPWPWPFAPVVDWQNLPLPGAYYGLSDLDDGDLQDAINYVASKVQRILRYHAHPKTIGRGFGGQDLKINEDDVVILPGTDPDLWNLEMQSDLGAAQAFLDKLIQWELSQARIPDLDPAKVNVGALSGFALSILYGDLLEKTELKRRTYGDALIEINRRLLAMRGMGDDKICTLHWQSPLPNDTQSEQARDQFELDYKLVSTETVQVRRGLDPEIERKRIDAERQAQEVAEGNIGAMLLREWETGRGVERTQPGQPAGAANG